MSGRPDGRAARIGELIGAVVRQALAARGLRRVALLDDGSPEAAWTARILAAQLGEESVVRVAATERQLEPVLQALRAAPDPCTVAAAEAVDAAAALDELRRLRARLLADALVANPANKTALLLGGPLPPEPLLPLGDLYASQVAELAGGWSAPAAVRELASAAGGVERLDAALHQRIDRRDPHGLDGLGAELKAAIEAALARGAAARVYPCVVPKLAARTLGVDLFE